MRLLILILSILIFQKTGSCQIQIGPKIGITFSKIRQPEGGFKFLYSKKFGKIKPSIGFGSKVKLSKLLYLQLDFLYTQKVAKVTHSHIDDYELKKVRNNYVDSNTQFCVKPYKFIFLDIGFYYSYLLSSKIWYNSWGIDGTSDGKSIFSNSDFGINIGTTLEHKGITIGMKYFHGLKQISPKLKNSFFQLTLGYYFKI